MLYEARMDCGVMDDSRDVMLCRLIGAGLRDLKTRGVTFEGDFTYTVDTPEGETLPAVTAWECTIEDDWIRTAALTYVKGSAPWIEDREKFMAAYETILDKMMGTSGYNRGWETEEDG